jgi:hypothetical protein
LENLRLEGRDNSGKRSLRNILGKPDVMAERDENDSRSFIWGGGFNISDVQNSSSATALPVTA